jgi:hypothetical protein
MIYLSQKLTEDVSINLLQKLTDLIYFFANTQPQG